MPAAAAALRKMRAICRSLPDTGQSEHFGQACFRVGRKIFASCGQKAGICRIVVQLEPEHARRLIKSRRGFDRYARQTDCVSIDVARLENLDEVQALVLESYRLNACASRKRPAKKPPKER
jgi:predicted DNA-binding protein (MmcQ/YjbR family)